MLARGLSSHGAAARRGVPARMAVVANYVRAMASAPTSGATGVFPDAPSPLQEFSVVYTDRALNHMSEPFKNVMTDISSTMKEAYNASACVLIPGSGSYGMEAVARQFAADKKVLALRNGFFSFRWSQIFDQGKIPSEHIVAKARCVTSPGADTSACRGQYEPVPIADLEALIAKEQPAVLFAPHIETSTGIILPDEYVTRAAAAMHKIGGLMVLDCIASGTVWIDMEKIGVDALITAPQKGWTGPACVGVVMLSARGVEATRASTSSSFCCDLRKWLELMDSYEAGGFMYHCTMPTDALIKVRDAMLQTKEFGWAASNDAAWELGKEVRNDMTAKGLVSVAAPGFQAPGVVVVHTDDAAIGGKFAAAGTQIAGGVPFMIDEPKETKTFRIGLFGLDKLKDPRKTADNLKLALDVAVPSVGHCT